MAGITHVSIESENRDYGQTLGDVNMDKRKRATWETEKLCPEASGEKVKV